MSDVEVSNNTELSRYEAHVDGELAGYAEYNLRSSTVVFTHTQVVVEGKGVGSSLVRQSLDQIRASGVYDVLPLCAFYKAWMEYHPEYDDLVHERPEGAVEGTPEGDA